MRASSLKLLLATTIGCSFMLLMTATAAPETNHVCNPKQLEIFSCLLKSEQLVGVCLDKSSLRMDYVRGNKNGRSIVPLSNVREAILFKNAHGDGIVLKSSIPDSTFELFANFDYYDMQNPVLVTETNGNTKREECKSKVVANTGVVTVNGRSKSINLVSLASNGVVTGLDTPPTWPDE